MEFPNQDGGWDGVYGVLMQQLIMVRSADCCSKINIKSGSFQSTGERRKEIM